MNRLEVPAVPAFRGSTTASGALRVENLSKNFGGLKVFNNISFELEPGKIVGVIGPNGAGKTTIINVISGMLRASAGKVILDGKTISDKPFYAVSQLGIARSFQQTNTFKSVSVEENLYRAARFTSRPSGPDVNMDPLLQEFGLTGHLHERSGSLPYGLQKMLGLLIVLAAKPKFLLLDEPAAGLERRERTQVDQYVEYARSALNCGVLMVEHDMDLVRRLCPHILVLEAGRLLAEGSPAEVLARQDVIDAYLGASED